MPFTVLKNIKRNHRIRHIAKRRTKMKKLYKFCPYKFTKVEPLGNLRNGTRCPKARSGHRIVVDGSNIYSFGGYNPQIPDEELDGNLLWMQSCLLFQELWKFNLASQTWSLLQTTGNMPEELASHAAILLDDCMLVYGGTGVPFGRSSSNNTHICNLRTKEWNQLETTGKKPLQQYGQAIVVHDGSLYVIGGTTGYEYSMDVHRLDLKTKVWEELETSAQPEPRYRHEIAIENNQLFVFGGGTAVECFGLKEVPVFNLETQQWKILPTSKEHPSPRRCHGCVQMGSKVFISGGHDGEQIFPDVWMIDMKTLLWRKLPCTLPQPVYFHSAALSPAGQMFIFGGVTDIEQNSRTNELYSVWLKIPSLSEMCWQAVLHYAPHISLLKKEHLFAAGIPVKFLNRVDFACDKDQDPVQTDL